MRGVDPTSTSNPVSLLPLPLTTRHGLVCVFVSLSYLQEASIEAGSQKIINNSMMSNVRQHTIIRDRGTMEPLSTSAVNPIKNRNPDSGHYR